MHYRSKNKIKIDKLKKGLGKGSKKKRKKKGKFQLFGDPSPPLKLENIQSFFFKDP